MAKGGDPLQQAREKLAAATGLNDDRLNTVLESFQENLEKIESAAEGLV